MSESEQIKRQVLGMAISEIEELLNIIGDLGYLGYKISLCKIKGNSYQQCANKFNIPKSTAQTYYEKCTEKAYDIALKRIFQLK